MIYKGTKVSIDDYSGAAFGKRINIFGGSYVSHASAGKFILITLAKNYNVFLFCFFFFLYFELEINKLIDFIKLFRNDYE